MTFFVTSFPKHVTFWPRRYKTFLNGKKSFLRRNVTIRLGLKHVFSLPVSDLSLVSEAWSGKAIWVKTDPESITRTPCIMCMYTSTLFALAILHQKIFSVDWPWPPPCPVTVRDFYRGNQRRDSDPPEYSYVFSWPWAGMAPMCCSHGQTWLGRGRLVEDGSFAQIRSTGFPQPKNGVMSRMKTGFW